MSDKSRSDYSPKGKYKIIKFQNGLGETWFQIQTQGWLFKRWFRCWYDTEYGWTPWIPEFKSEDEAIQFMRSERDKQTRLELKNTVFETEGVDVKI